MEQFNNFINKFKLNEKDENNGNFRAMNGGGKYYIDLLDRTIRKEVIDALKNSSFWLRSFKEQTNYKKNACGYNKFSATQFLMNATPRNTPSIFYMDIDGFELPLDQIKDICCQWTEKVCGSPKSKNRIYFYKSVKEETGKTGYHIYWPDLLLLLKDEKELLSLSLATLLGLVDKQYDSSVYATGLRLPGFFKGGNKIDTSYYYFVGSNDGSLPDVDDILLTPHPDLNQKFNDQEALNEINWNFVKSAILPEVLARFEESKKKRKIKSNNQVSTSTEREEGLIVNNKWEDVNVPKWVLDLIQVKSGFYQPYSIKMKGNQPHSWVIDYNRSKGECVLGKRRHDSCGCFINWNPETNGIRYMCLANGCRDQGWVTVKKGSQIKLTKPVPQWVFEKVHDAISDYAQEPLEIVKKGKMDNEVVLRGKLKDDVDQIPNSPECYRCFNNNNHEITVDKDFQVSILIDDKSNEVELKCMHQDCQSQDSQIINESCNSEDVLYSEDQANVDHLPKGELHFHDVLVSLCKSTFTRVPNPNQILLTLLTFLNFHIAYLRKPSAMVERYSCSEWYLTTREQISCQLSMYRIKLYPSGLIKPVFDLWKTWIGAKFFNQLVFDPKEDIKNIKNLNIYSGIKIPPANYSPEVLAEKVKPLIDHIRFIWCREDQDSDGPKRSKWILGHFASIFQKPWEKTKIALVLRSKQGAGKNIVFDLFTQIWGPQHVYVVDNMDSVFGAFNSHVAQSIFLVFDETVYANSVREAQKLKSLITGQLLEMRKKFSDNIMVHNYSNVVILSNNENVCLVEHSDRRNFNLELDNRYSGPKTPEIKAYMDRLANCDLGAIVQYFLQFDISDHDSGNPPRTLDTVKHKLASLDPIPLWIYYLLVDDDSNGTLADWIEKKEVPIADVGKMFFENFLTREMKSKMINKSRNHFYSVLCSTFGFSRSGSFKKFKSETGTQVSSEIMLIPSYEVLLKNFEMYLGHNIDAFLTGSTLS